jgi:hypothetical protein
MSSLRLRHASRIHAQRIDAGRLLHRAAIAIVMLALSQIGSVLSASLSPRLSQWCSVAARQGTESMNQRDPIVI